MCTDMYRVAVMKISYASIIYISYILLSFPNKTRAIPWKTRCSISSSLFFSSYYSFVPISLKNVRVQRRRIVLRSRDVHDVHDLEKSKAPDPSNAKDGIPTARFVMLNKIASSRLVSHPSLSINPDQDKNYNLMLRCGENTE